MNSKVKYNLSRREYFLYITKKRIIRAVAMISSFKNFYSKHNIRYYEFTEEDMLKLDIKLTSALEEWRESYQQHFKEKRLKELYFTDRQLHKISKDLGGNKTAVILDWVRENNR